MPRITEYEARQIIQKECKNLAFAAEEAAGKLIVQAVLENENNYEAIFDCARSIMTAFSNAMTYYKQG